MANTNTAIDDEQDERENAEELPPYLVDQLGRRSLAGIGPISTPAPTPIQPTATAQPSISGSAPIAAPQPPSISGLDKPLAQAPLPASIAPSGPNLASDVAAGRVTQPTFGDYKPAHVSKGRRIAGAIIGGLEGLRDPEAGAETARSIAYGPALQRMGQDTAEYNAALSAGQKQQASEKEKSAEALQNAQTENLQSEIDARKNPTPKEGVTPDEMALHDLMTGNNGQPRVNPDTGKPYSYLEAYSAVKQAAEGAKPDKTLSEEQQFISQYLRDNHLPDTSANRLKAHQEWTLKPDTAGKNDARLDRSYQFNSTQLEKVRVPIDAIATRIGNLGSSLEQATPQSDALVAPELLSIMAGGQGSGLRMNEAEIARIVGGRSKWQSLQAAVNQWKLDPTKANSITPEQRKEIHALYQAVRDKVSKKQAALEQAEGALIDADDPKAHRKIVGDLRKQLDAIDSGAAAGGDTVLMKAPNGQTKPVPADQVNHFKKLGATVVSQ